MTSLPCLDEMHRPEPHHHYKTGKAYRCTLLNPENCSRAFYEPSYAKRSWVAYVESLDGSAVLLTSQWARSDAEKAGRRILQDNPQDWSEHDRLVVAQVVLDMPVEMVVMD